MNLGPQLFISISWDFSSALGASVEMNKREQKEKEKERKRERRGKMEGRKNILGSYYVPDTIYCVYLHT